MIILLVGPRRTCGAIPWCTHRRKKLSDHWSCPSVPGVPNASPWFGTPSLSAIVGLSVVRGLPAVAATEH